MFPPDGGKKPRRWLAPCWSCLEAADVGVGDMNIPWAWRALERCLGVGIIFFVRAEFSTERFDTFDTLLDSIGWSPIWKHQFGSIWWVSAVIWWCFNKFPLNGFLVPDSAGWFAGGQNHLFAGSECQHPVKITIFSWFIQLLPVKIITRGSSGSHVLRSQAAGRAEVSGRCEPYQLRRRRTAACGCLERPTAYAPWGGTTVQGRTHMGTIQPG